MGGALDLAGEGVGHPGVRDGLRLVVPDLLVVLADDLRDDELHVLRHQLALLPGDGLAGLSAGPDLSREDRGVMRTMSVRLQPASRICLSPSW